MQAARKAYQLDGRDIEGLASELRVSVSTLRRAFRLLPDELAK